MLLKQEKFHLQDLEVCFTVNPINPKFQPQKIYKEKDILAKETTELFEDTGLSMTDILTTEELGKALGYKTIEFNSLIGGALGNELGNGVLVYRMTGEEPTNKVGWLRELVIPKSEISSIAKTLNRSYNGN